jgi:hypothetical protein
MASTGKRFGLKLYIHSMTNNIITTSNYTQLQLNELPPYNWNIVESGGHFLLFCFFIFFNRDLPWHKTMISSIQQYKKSGTSMIIMQILTWHKRIVHCIYKFSVVLGKRLKCKSLRTMRRDGHQVMIIPLITLKGLIFIQALEWIYNFKPKLFPVDAIGFNAGFKYIKVYILPICHI